MPRIVLPGIVMAVEGLAHAQATRQHINSIPTVSMNTWRFMRHERIGAFAHETEIVHRKDHAAVLARQSVLPEVAAANRLHEIAWWRPNPRQGLRCARLPRQLLWRAGCAVPGLSQTRCRGPHRSRCHPESCAVRVAMVFAPVDRLENDGHGLVGMHHINGVVKVSMRIAAKENVISHVD